MKHHAIPGDTYRFGPAPLITYVAECSRCTERRGSGRREFSHQVGRDEWARDHAGAWQGAEHPHVVTTWTEVQG